MVGKPIKKGVTFTTAHADTDAAEERLHRSSPTVFAVAYDVVKQVATGNIQPTAPLVCVCVAPPLEGLRQVFYAFWGIGHGRREAAETHSPILRAYPAVETAIRNDYIESHKIPRYSLFCGLG